MGTVSKALSLLTNFNQSRTEIGLSEIARLAGVNKATAYRLLTELQAGGFVEQTGADKSWRLGPEILRLARVREAAVPMTTASRAILDRLAAETHETAHVSVLRGTELNALAHAYSTRHATRVMMEDAERLSMHGTGSGLAVLAFSPDDFVESVLAEHANKVRQLRREFQMLRPSGLGRERGAREGDSLDVDALVGELVETRLGRPGEGRVYLRRVRRERDVAVAFLVDLSASTRELVAEGGKSVIEVEKEALVLMSEALEALGDRYGIFGFSGRGRQMVTFDVFKDFDERWNEPVKGRIGAMTYRMENRDGAAIRHATRRLAAVDARVRLLVLLSDGKPLDCGCDLYQAAYAQADTRMALREAREHRVHPFCITVDPHGEDYLRAMYGDVRYTVIDSVEQLPSRLPAIYRRLTT